MTINDLPLNEDCQKVRHLAEELPVLMRNGNESELSMALYQILCYAGRARRRMNDLGYWDPLREPMGS